MKKILKRLGTGLIVLIILSAIFGSNDSTDKIQVDKNESDQVSELEEVDDDVPTEYKSALKKANSYSKNFHMSKSGVYNQLVSEHGENFPEDAAQYAMENIKADWNENALKKAESYAKNMHMSKKGIYDQLVSEHGENFEESEAQYAINSFTWDWKRNALEKAKIYQDSMSMSKEKIREQLTSDYGEQFTQEEADWAVENLE